MSTLTVRADSRPTPLAAAVAPPSFWHRPIVQDVLPFCSSLALHLGLIVVGILTYKAAMILTDATRTPTVIPEASPIDGEMSRVPSLDGLLPDARLPVGQLADAFTPPDPHGMSTAAAAIVNIRAGGNNDGSESDDAIALGLQKKFGSPGKGDGHGIGIGNGTEGGSQGLAPYRETSLGTPTFTGYARKVLFLCDSSGSMTPKFDALRTELRKAIDVLRPNQEFDVIFFSEDQYVALDKSLLYALPENKRRAHEFLDRVTPHGSSDPLPGLRAAFGANPQLIFMLTDGDFPNNDAVLAEIRKLRGNTGVKVNTIAFMDRGEAYEKLLGDVARETGGVFRFVSEQDLGDGK